MREPKTQAASSSLGNVSVLTGATRALKMQNETTGLLCLFSSFVSSLHEPTHISDGIVHQGGGVTEYVKLKFHYFSVHSTPGKNCLGMEKSFNRSTSDNQIIILSFSSTGKGESHSSW